MALEKQTLGEFLSDPRIRPIARDAIRNRDLRREPIWNCTPEELRKNYSITGDIIGGIRRLYAAADTKDWFYPLYSEIECARDPARKGVNLVWFPSEAPEADEKPFILLVPGGGFINVWNLTEGWPIAARFNRNGYHVFILTYQVDGNRGLLAKNMEDFSRALKLIRDREDHFHVCGDRYITCGFSAGGYLICLWNTGLGYRLHQMEKPRGCIPVYPVVTLKKGVRYGPDDPASSIRLYGCTAEEAIRKDFEIPEHAEGFPPTAVFVAAEDDLVNPDNSRMLAGALNTLGIPCRLEIGATGGHGFADGNGMSMDGWPERAAKWADLLR